MILTINFAVKMIVEWLPASGPQTGIVLSHNLEDKGCLSEAVRQSVRL